MTILLTIVTFTVWGWIAFYQTAQRYRRLAGVGGPNFEGLFWIAVAFSVASIAFAPLFLGTIIAGALLLRDVIALRDQAMQRITVREPTHGLDIFKSRDWHVGMYVVGEILSVLIVGIVVLIVQAVQFFNEWNRVATVLRARLNAAGGYAP